MTFSISLFEYTSIRYVKINESDGDVVTYCWRVRLISTRLFLLCLNVIGQIFIYLRRLYF